MEPEQQMSKYARKKAARMATTQRTFSAINLAVQITNGTIKPKAKKPKQPPPEPRGLVADLGDRPEKLAVLLTDCANLLVEASSLADKILELAKRGIQQSEPRAISQFLVPTAQRVAGMAARARRIINKKGGV